MLLRFTAATAAAGSPDTSVPSACNCAPVKEEACAGLKPATPAVVMAAIWVASRLAIAAAENPATFESNAVI